MAGIRAVCVGADVVWLEFTGFPFVALKACPVRCGHLVWGEDGEELSSSIRYDNKINKMKQM